MPRLNLTGAQLHCNLVPGPGACPGLTKQGPNFILSSGPAQEAGKCLIHQDAQTHANRSRVLPKLVPGLTEVRVRALFHPKQLVPDLLIWLESRGPALARVGHFKLRSKPSAPMIISTNR